MSRCIRCYKVIRNDKGSVCDDCYEEWRIAGELENERAQKDYNEEVKA